MGKEDGKRNAYEETSEPLEGFERLCVRRQRLQR